MEDDVNEIRFYRATGEHGYLSNLWPAPLVVDGREFSCAEFAYQWAKFADPAARDWAMLAPGASLCAQLAHSLLPWQVATGWSEAKVNRMRLVLSAKFLQHSDLAAKLLATGDASLIEESKTDAFWGLGKSGRGRNVLGVLLGELRSQLRHSRHGLGEAVSGG